MQKLSLDEYVYKLENTPEILMRTFKNVSQQNILYKNKENDWHCLDVIGHLILCEKINFIRRIELILSDDVDKTIIPIDQFSHDEIISNKNINELLNTFKEFRIKNINQLKSYNLNDFELKRTATHVVLGEITLQQVLSTWVVHDYSHLNQINKNLAITYKSEVGPFKQYLKIIQNKNEF